jgi:hypothetical protein
MLNETGDLRWVLSTGKVPFRMNGQVNHHNYWIQEAEQPHVIPVCVCMTLKVNTWCGLLCDCVIGPFLFAENTIIVNIYLNMLELFAFLKEHLLLNEHHYTECVKAILLPLGQLSVHTHAHTQEASIRTLWLAEHFTTNHMIMWLKIIDITLKQGSSFSMILYTKCCNFFF